MTIIAANYLTHLESDSSQVYRYLVTNPSVREIVTSQDFLDAAYAELGSAVARDAGKIVYDGGSQDFFGHTWAIMIDDTSPTVPQEKIVDLYPKTKNKDVFGKRWAKRTRSKDILVSDYLRGQAHLSYVHGYKKNWEGPTYRDLTYAAQTGLFALATVNSQWITMNGWVWEGPRFNKVRHAETRETLGFFPPFPEGAVLQNIKQHFNNQPVNNGLVVATTSDANQGTLDALTSLAEMPETIKSILDACKTMTRMYVDTRNKAWRIYNKGKGNTSLGQDRETLLRNIREVADAISNVWLQYRYNITPTVLMVKDLLKTLESSVEEYVRFRKTKNQKEIYKHELDGWVCDTSYNTINRVLIKRLLDVSMDFVKLEHLVLTNAAVTLYELTPFSFVYDWFINLGDLITAAFVHPSIRQQGATYSWKTKAALVYTHEETNARVFIDVSVYKRNVINLSNHLQLQWDPTIGWKRQLDALALGWQIHRTSVMKLMTRAIASNR